MIMQTLCNLDEMTEDIIPYFELEDSSSSDESDDDLEVTSDSSDEESYNRKLKYIH